MDIKQEILPLEDGVEVKANEITQLQEDFKKRFNNLPDFIRNMNIIVSNQLPLLPQKFDLNQKRILAYAIGLIQKNQRESEITEFKDNTFTIQVSNFKQAFGIEERKGGALYNELKDATLKLAKEHLYYKNERKNIEVYLNWCQKIVYENNEGRIHIKFTEEISKYLTQIADNYTRYNVFISHSFKSVYSIRIYEIMQTRKDTNMIIMSYEDFKKVLDVPTSYNKPGLIKAKILDRVEEDFKNIGINFKYDFVKDKRYDGNYKVILKTDKNEDDLLLWLNSKENKIHKEIKEIDNKLKLVEVSSMDDPRLPF